MDEGSSSVIVKENKTEICGWTTHTYDLDHYDSGDGNDPKYPHTVLIFVPGNPGCVGWYIGMLKTIVGRLGIGYSCRAVNYAGHSTEPHLVRAKDDAAEKVAWTVDGQVQHKIEWIDKVTADFVETRPESANLPRFIFVSHSIGGQLVQRFCLLRKDILFRTDAILHLMPFIRFDTKNALLSTFANSPNWTISMMRMGSKFAAKMPDGFSHGILEHIAGMSLSDDRRIAIDLFQNHEYVKNHLELGLEEIREIPECHDMAALELLSKYCPMFILYAGGPDQWAPESHMQELKNGIATGVLPDNIKLQYNENLLHDFIVRQGMTQPTVEFVLNSINRLGPWTEVALKKDDILISKL